MTQRTFIIICISIALAFGISCFFIGYSQKKERTVIVPVDNIEWKSEKDSLLKEIADLQDSDLQNVKAISELTTLKYEQLKKINAYSKRDIHDWIEFYSKESGYNVHSNAGSAKNDF